MFTHVLSRSWNSNGATITGTTSISAGGESNIDEAIASNASALAVGYTAVPANLKSLFIFCLESDIEIRANNALTPSNTFLISAGVPFLWVVGDPALTDTSGGAVTTSITGLFVTNSGGVNATLKIRSLFDPTP